MIYKDKSISELKEFIEKEMTDKELLARILELEDEARANRDKWDTQPITDWLDEDAIEEYEFLVSVFNKRKRNKKKKR